MKKFLKNSRMAILGLVAVLAVSGAGMSRAIAQEEPAPTPAPEPQPALNDAQVLSIVGAVNNMEISLGNLAAEKASNTAVKEFAATMVKKHTEANEKVTSVMTALNLQPAEHPVITATQQRGQAVAAQLNDLTGEAFDKAYITDQVKTHQDVLTLLDKHLIPGAQANEVKSLLTEARDAVDMHLKAAQAIQEALP